MPPTPHIEIIEQLEKELNVAGPVSQERLQKQLQELRTNLPTLRADHPDFEGLQKRVNVILERSEKHLQAVADARADILALRAQVNPVPVRPPEFTRPSSGPARLDPGPRRPVLGGALLGTGAFIGGTLGLSMLWQFLSHPVETSKSVGKTLLAVGAVGALAVGGWFGFNAMNWREVGQTIRGWWNGMSDGVGGAGNFFSETVRGARDGFFGWMGWPVPESAEKTAKEAEAKKKEEEGKKKEGEGKVKAETAKKEAEDKIAKSKKAAEEKIAAQKLEAERKAATEKFRQAAEKAIPAGVNLVNQVLTLRPGLTVNVPPVPSGQNPVLIINGVRWRVVPTGVANARYYRIMNITRTGDGAYNISGQHYNRYPTGTEFGVIDHAGAASFAQMFDGIERIADTTGPLYTVPAPPNSLLARLAGLGRFTLRRE